MAKNNNKGISFVEVIISITIFAILMIPITTKLISSMNINTRTKERQYVTAYAEQAMEYFKGYDFDNIPMLKDADGVSVPLSSTGKEEKTVTVNATDVTYYEYTYTTDVKLGPKKEAYDCKVTLSTLDYALRAIGYEVNDAGEYTEIDPSLVVDDPNAVNLGNVRSMDAYSDAIIWNASNFDSVAEDSMYASKIDKLKMLAEENPTPGSPNYDNWLKYLNGTYRFDTNHTVKKNTRIVIQKNADGEYVVNCTVEYNDVLSEYTIDPISYNIYTATFANKPNIYLMFNQCMYNNLYADDNIIIDKTGINNEECNVYIIGTYETTGGGEAALDDDGNEIAGNKVYEILGADSPNATKSQSGDYVEAELIKKAGGYYPYDKDGAGEYRFKVFINSVAGANSQNNLNVYVSDSTDDRYNLYGRTFGNKLIDRIVNNTANETMNSGVIKKLSSEQRLSETGSLFTINVELLREDGNEGGNVTLKGTKGGN